MTGLLQGFPIQPTPGLPFAGGEADGDNSASPSPLLERLFPAGVIGAELRIPGDPLLLFPAERLCIGRAVPERAREFAAGRQCARLALAKFGYAQSPLGMNRDRRPRWPDPIIGSISHTTGICGAVVAERRQFSAIGLDMEIVGQVTREIWPYIFTREEIAWLAAFPAAEQARYAALAFSAKEAFYKCQYGVTQLWLEFQDVALDAASSDWAAGSFALKPHHKILLSDARSRPWRGRFEFQGSLVVTGMILEAH